jgi:hypothetical protein
VGTAHPTIKFVLLGEMQQVISEQMTNQIADKAEQQGIDENLVSVLRSEFPDVHFTYCMDDDIFHGTPVLQRQSFNLYLVDGREHCLKLTDSYEVATGYVLAETIED